jgi:hypothetical protein
MTALKRSLLLVLSLAGPSIGRASSDTILEACAVEPISDRQILPDVSVAALACNPQVEAVASLGEFEPASVAIRAEVPIPDLVVEFGSLVSKSGQEFPRTLIDVKIVKVWYQSGTAWRGIRQDRSHRVLVPELLLNDDDLVRVAPARQTNWVKLRDPDRFEDVQEFGDSSALKVEDLRLFEVRDAAALVPLSLPPNTTRQLWITFEITDDIRPGDYQGKLLLRSNRLKVRVEVPVLLKVLPIRLTAPSLEYCLYYTGELDEMGIGSISSTKKSLSQLRAEFADIRRHGVSNLTIYQDPSSLTALERLLQERRFAGLDNRRIYLVGLNTGNYTATADVARRVDLVGAIRRRLGGKFGVTAFYVYGVDEADDKTILRQRAAWDSFRAAGARIFAAAWHLTPAARYYAGRIDLLVLGSEPEPAAISFFKKSGTRVYLYNQPQAGLEDPAVYRRNYGFRAWADGFDGVMDYAYQRSMGFIWNDFDNADYRDTTFTYPTSDGVIDTIAWEGFREGIDDVRYVTSLETVAASGGAGKEVVDSIRTRVFGESPEAVRRRVIEEILRICAKSRASSEGMAVCR